MVRTTVQRLRESYRRDLGAVGTFLPDTVPVDRLPAEFAPFLAACAELPGRYPADRGGVRAWLDRMFGAADPAVTGAVGSLAEPELHALLTALSVLAHVYRWDHVPPARERFADRTVALPAGIDGPWRAVTGRLGEPRVGTTWSMHLCNWRMTDRPAGARYAPEELTPENLRVAYQWLAPPVDSDLERFSLTFVLMEARAAAALAALVRAIEAAAARDGDRCLAALGDLETGVKAMSAAFTASVRAAHIDPAAWLELIQPTFAWAVRTDEGVHSGPSGMQLPSIQVLDAALGVPERSYLAGECRRARRYLRAPHRHFLDAVDGAAAILPGFVREAGGAELRTALARCVRWLHTFRVAHSARGARYLGAGREGEQARVSTGLGISWRPDQDDGHAAPDGAPGPAAVDAVADPVGYFTRTMAGRIAETRQAMAAE